MKPCVIAICNVLPAGGAGSRMVFFPYMIDVCCKIPSFVNDYPGRNHQIQTLHYSEAEWFWNYVAHLGLVGLNILLPLTAACKATRKELSSRQLVAELTQGRGADSGLLES